MVVGRRRVVWTKSARDALDEAIAYIAQNSPTTARNVLTEILEKVGTLDRFSERGRIVPELEDPVVREVFAYSYRLIYRVSATEVQVLAVVHQARDFASRLEKPE